MVYQRVSNRVYDVSSREVRGVAVVRAVPCEVHGQVRARCGRHHAYRVVGMVWPLGTIAVPGHSRRQGRSRGGPLAGS